ncbi:MAG: WD40 repeat domain-containing protein, partial [Chloroflexota bacterium]
QSIEFTIEDGATDISFSPDNTRLAVNLSQTVEIWDTSSWTKVGEIKNQTGGFITDISYSPDGQVFALATSNFDSPPLYQVGTVELWDAKTLQFIVSMEGSGGDVNSVAFSPDGKTIASGGDAAGDFVAVKVWDVSTAQSIQVFDTHVTAQSLAFSPDGQTLAIGTDSGESEDHSAVLLMDTKTGKMKQKLEGFSAPVYHVSYSRDGTKIAASSEKTVIMFDAATGQEISVLSVGLGSVTSFVFTPDDRFLIVRTNDSDIGIWDAEQGSLMESIKGHTSEGLVLAVSPDGKWLASADWFICRGECSVRIWELAKYLPQN